jgi:hypothetical protein
MAVRVHVWQVGSAWLASCPSLESGGRGKTRDAALRELRTEIRDELEMVFNADLEVVEGPPPMEDTR